MIVEFRVKNYLSIKDEIVLSMEASSSTSRLKENICEENKTKLLKSIAIYGGNATGKSNLIKAVNFFRAMIVNSQNHQFGAKINIAPYKLDSKITNQPTKFEITFILNSIKYTYGFSCTKDKIINEYLTSVSGPGRPKELFKRIDTKNFNFTSDVSKQKRIKDDTNENQLYLSKVALSNYENLKSIYSFLSEDVIINVNHLWARYTKDKLHKDSKFKRWAVDILKKGDFGGITNIKTEIKERSVKGFDFQVGETVSVKEINKEKEEYLDVKFVHKDDKKKDVFFEEIEESYGTLKTFSMLGPIYDALKKGKTLFIDEFEINLHPEITRFLLKLFHSKHNKKNSQIIFTTHDTSLLRGKDLLRRDQIYFTEKEPNKSTKLYSLMDYNVREDVDFQNIYLNGKVGGVPFVDESYV